MLLVSSHSRGEGRYVRLAMKHWGLRLLTYTVAFQKSLTLDITRFEPRASQWLYGILWQLEVGATPAPTRSDLIVRYGPPPPEKLLPPMNPNRMRRCVAEST